MARVRTFVPSWPGSLEAPFHGGATVVGHAPGNVSSRPRKRMQTLRPRCFTVNHSQLATSPRSVFRCASENGTHYPRVRYQDPTVSRLR